MAKLFIGIDKNTEKKYKYIFGETNDFRKFLSVMNKILDQPLGCITDKEIKVLKYVLTNDEFKKISLKKLLAYECTIRPFSNGKQVESLPWVHLKFEDEDYLRKYDDLKLLNISKDSINLPSPVDGEYSVEVMEIKEVN